MNAWEDSTEGGSEWTEILQTVSKILYACAVIDDPKFTSYSANKLHQMLSRRNIATSEEACHTIDCLNQIYEALSLQGKNVHLKK